MNVNPLLLTDFYKTDHRRQYPKGTEYVYSNFTPRGSRIDGVNEVVVFGIQYFVKEYLIKQFTEGFFNKDKETVIAEYKRRLDTSLGPDAVSMEHIEALHDLGYLPIKVKALPEGTLCPMRVPLLTIVNTHPEFFWVTNFLETLLSTVLWGPITSATIAHTYRKLLDKFAADTSDSPEFVDWQGHDFSMRGLMGIQSSMVSGGAHLLSFTGTDTIPAIDFLEMYYNADAEKELIGGSVPATEHSVMSLGGLEDEFGTFKNLITNVYPKGIISIVSDTWDFWEVMTDYLPRLKEMILARDGKVVIRPDSGDPVDIICGEKWGVEIGTPVYRGAVELLWETFGGKVNSKGFKELDPHIGIIYGDSITLERCEAICSRLEEQGFASTNVVFGIGSFTYQYNTRDTFGFAMKATWGQVNGVAKDIFKDPVTDDGLKKSARGLLTVVPDDNGTLFVQERVSKLSETRGALQVVFEDGVGFAETSLAEIRARLKSK